MKISSKILTLVLSLVLISILLTSGVFLFITFSNTQKQLEQHLESVLLIKGNQLTYYFNHQNEVLNFIQNQTILEFYDSYESGSENLEKEKEILGSSLTNLESNSLFFEVFLMDRTGKIIFSTKQEEENKIKKDKLYFINGKTRNYIQKYYYSQSLDEPAITVSRPITDINGELKIVIAARVDLNEFSKLMAENPGLGKTGETYLVNKFNYAVTELKKKQSVALREIVYTKAVEDCLDNKNKEIVFDNYKSYDDNDVFGAYIWLSESDVCMIVEIDEAEAHAYIYDKLIILVIFGILILIVSILLSLFIAKNLRKKLLNLSETAKKVSQGDLDSGIQIITKDEIGDLAQSFNYMISELKGSQKKIKEEEEILEKTVEQRTQEIQKKLDEIENTKLAVMNILEDTDESNKQLMELKDQLNKNIKELKLMDKTKDEFLSITAHELKTPITSIRGFLELLQNEKVINNKESREKYFDIIIEDTFRLAQLVTDILDLSRLDIGTMKFNMDKVSLASIFEDLKNLEEIAIKNKGVNPIFEYDKNIPDLYVDKSRLLQVLSNLINNSIKYTEKGFIKTKAELKDKAVHFSVEDTGTGIPQKEHKKIFRRFYQVDSSYTRKVGGTGLGLSICEGIVEQFGGKIWVEKSEIGKGTTIGFMIPLNKRENKKQQKRK